LCPNCARTRPKITTALGRGAEFAAPANFSRPDRKPHVALRDEVVPPARISPGGQQSDHERARARFTVGLFNCPPRRAACGQEAAVSRVNGMIYLSGWTPTTPTR